MALREGEKKGKKIGSKHFRLQCSSKGKLESLSGSSCDKLAHEMRPTSSLSCIRPTSAISYHAQSLIGRSPHEVRLRCEGGDQLWTATLGAVGQLHFLQ